MQEKNQKKLKKNQKEHISYIVLVSFQELNGKGGVCQVLGVGW
jgi:hypothetical protein